MGRCNTIWYKSSLPRWCLWPKGTDGTFCGAEDRGMVRWKTGQSLQEIGRAFGRVTRQFAVWSRVTGGLFRQSVGGRSSRSIGT
jgi:hypothetical protein